MGPNTSQYYEQSDEDFNLAVEKCVEILTRLI